MIRAHNEPMNMLYDSESFVVVHIQTDVALAGIELGSTTSSVNDSDVRPRLARHGFEIVDKRTGREIYLDGSWAEMFQQQINAWQADTPSQEEVEDTLERYAALAQTPVLVH
jgi:hypothetical protein